MSEFKPVDLFEYGKAKDNEWTPEMIDSVLDELANLRERLVHDGHTKACFDSRQLNNTPCDCGADDVWKKLLEAIK